MNIFLNNARSVAHARRSFNDFTNLIEFSCHLNSTSLICTLTGLNDPDVFGRYLSLVIIRFFESPFLLVFFFYLLVVFLESGKFRISQTFLDMKCNGQGIKRILFQGIIIILHIDE